MAKLRYEVASDERRTTCDASPFQRVGADVLPFSVCLSVLIPKLIGERCRFSLHMSKVGLLRYRTPDPPQECPETLESIILTNDHREIRTDVIQELKVQGIERLAERRPRFGCLGKLISNQLQFSPPPPQVR